MQRQFDRDEISFRQQVADFLDANWDSAWCNDHAGVFASERAAWRQALVAQGWSVPGWPAAAGGPDWSPVQNFIWQQACAARGIDVEADPGVTVVGPLLLQESAAAVQDTFLPGIRDLRSRWCIGFAEPDSGLTLQRLSTHAQPVAGGYQLNGIKHWVRDGADAHWMCCLARMGKGMEDFALFAVNMLNPSVSTRRIQTLDGALNMTEVNFDNVHVPVDCLLAGPDEGRRFAQFFITSEYSTLSKSAVARAQLELLDITLATVDPADGLHTKRDALAVDLHGLEALELRFLDALARSVEPPFSVLLLRLRSREILLQLGTLQMESFGYYALPYPHETLLHNEGPIGPDAAVATIRRDLAQRVAELYEGSTQNLQNQMVRQLGIDDD